jgi:hypothetical protein
MSCCVVTGNNPKLPSLRQFYEWQLENETISDAENCFCSSLKKINLKKIIFTMYLTILAQQHECRDNKT